MTADLDSIFMTGFPGFLCRRLLRELAQGRPTSRFTLLVEARFVERADQRLEEMDSELPGLVDRCTVVVGDIVEPGLGMTARDLAKTRRETRQIWHLAALYNLAVSEEIAYRVNVLGTINVLDFAESCDDLARLLYISTCYVAGQRTGRIREVELDEGQGFKNHYESTKFWAEVEVQKRWRRIPTTIFRPAIVVGDTTTGRTDKYDGPYYMIQLLMRLPQGVPLPNIGRGVARVNIVPVDFLVAAMVSLAAHDDAVGEVFQLADPNPMTANDLLALMLDTLGRPSAVGSIPSLLADVALRSRRLAKFAQVPREMVAYFSHEATYDTSNTDLFLSGTPLRCPPLSSYLDVLIDYVKRHPDRPGGHA